MQADTKRRLRRDIEAAGCAVIPFASDMPLQTRRISTALAGHSIGSEIQAHEEIASTSDHVRELGLAGWPHGLVVFAESQSAGRGRRENRWCSEPSKDLLFSILLRPAVPVERWARLATLTALGICHAIEESLALRPQIKWPNDLMLRDRKFCGILAETHLGAADPFIVLGVGLNVNSTTFAPDLQGLATSLCNECGSKILDRTQLAIKLLQCLERVLEKWERGFPDVITEVQSRSWLMGKRIRAQHHDAQTEGVVTGLNAEGWLIVKHDDGTVSTLGSAEQVRVV